MNSSRWPSAVRKKLLQRSLLRKGRALPRSSAKGASTPRDVDRVRVLHLRPFVAIPMESCLALRAVQAYSKSVLTWLSYSDGCLNFCSCPSVWDSTPDCQKKLRGST